MGKKELKKEARDNKRRLKRIAKIEQDWRYIRAGLILLGDKAIMEGKETEEIVDEMIEV